MSKKSIQGLLSVINTAGIFSEIDIHFGNFIDGFSPNSDPDIFLAAALVSHTTASGNTCLNLEAICENLLAGTQEDREPIECPQLDV